MSDFSKTGNNLDSTSPLGQPLSPTTARAGSSTTAGVFARLVGSLPTLVVLGVLGAFAYWGHHAGWSIPKFSSLRGADATGKDDWCEEHGVPESQCVECQPELMP